MASWREGASAECQQDLDRLLDAALPFAQEMLAKRGEFFPYAVAIALDGQEQMIAGDPGLGERPPSADVISVLEQGLRAHAGDKRAAAIVADVRLRNQDSDAIQVSLEHREGLAITAYLPYKKPRFGSGIRYGEMAAAPGQRKIWSTSI